MRDAYGGEQVMSRVMQSRIHVTCAERTGYGGYSELVTSLF